MDIAVVDVSLRRYMEVRECRLRNHGHSFF